MWSKTVSEIAGFCTMPLNDIGFVYGNVFIFHCICIVLFCATFLRGAAFFLQFRLYARLVENL